MVHFNWTQLIPGVGHEYIHVATALIVSLFLIVFAVLGRVALGTGEAAIGPSGKLSIKGVFELITEFIVSLTVMVIGEKGRHYTPMFAAIFLFIFINNITGLLPGMTPATDNMNTTIAVGLFSFIIYNLFGLKEHGIAYLKHFLGPSLPWYLFFIPIMMLCIELISHTVRPFSLALRLRGNMTGDHAVLSAFLDLVPIVVPVAFYCLGLFVCFMQAFVFTLLTMIYVSMAISHDH